MSGMKRGATLLWVLLAVLARVAGAQMVTTTVADTVYSASGVPAAGAVVINWSAFTTAGGESIPAGTTTTTIGAGGALSVALAPNAGATPMGSYYTAVFHLSDGTISKQYWVVPVTVPGGGPAKLAAIENSVLPTSVAMQTVSKQYVDNLVAHAQIGAVPADASPYVEKAGDTMTGPLELPGDPVSPNQAADKHYVDENIAAVTGGVGAAVQTLPGTTQTVVQPSGTQLQVNILNGTLSASQFVSGAGVNGIANVLAAPDCASGCRIVVDPTYTKQEPDGVGSLQDELAFTDERGGAESGFAVNPLTPGTTNSTAKTLTTFETKSQQQWSALIPYLAEITATTENLTTLAEAGGNNLLPANIENVPYGKSTYGVLAMTGAYNTQGQHIQSNSSIHCYGVGDCLAGAQFIYSDGGYRDVADEGTHPFDLQVLEDYVVFGGACATGCTPGSTTIGAAASVGQGTQGDGRFLIDTNPAKTINTGSITGGGKTIFGTVTFSGTNFPVSVFLSTAAAATSQAGNMAPGTVTLPIATSGVTAGFATSTAALPATTGVACLADPELSTQIPNYEMGNYTVVDATHLQLTLNKPHASGATIAVGGLCGYGVQQAVDETINIKQVFPVVGSIDATHLYYADGASPVIGGYAGGNSTSGYVNIALGIATIARSGNVVTVTTTANPQVDVNGLTLTVSGVADATYNGSYAVTSTGYNTITYANTGADSTSSGGQMTMVTGGYNLYPMAEVLSVFDPVSKTVDGTFSLAPNNIAWAAGDSLEEPHYHQQVTFGDNEIVTQYVPRPIQYVQSGKAFNGQLGPGVRGWQIANYVPASNYFGAGGTHNLPDDAYTVVGPWHNDFEVEAGASSVLDVHCSLLGCNRWDSAYNLFLMDSANGADYERYDPLSSTISWSMNGVPYSMSQTGFTARTINVGTLNATTITGGVSGAAINSGTVSAARLPLFGPSGTTHAPGIVPDPGAVAGATRYLREDGTWDVPAGGGSSGGTASFSGNMVAGTNPPVVAIADTTTGTGDPLIMTCPNGALNNPCLFGIGTAFAANQMGFVAWEPDTVPFMQVQTYNYGNPIQLAASAINTTASLMVNNGATLNALGAVCGTGISLCVNAASSMTVDTSGDLSATSYAGPPTAPTGSCPKSGVWVFSQDGHATFCAAGSWVTKI